MGYLVFGVRVLLGVFLIWSGLSKVSDPRAFAFVVESYGIVGPTLSLWIALVLPWVEIVLGFAFVAGIYIRLASVATMGLSIIFGIALVLNFGQELPLGCGCFGLSQEPEVVGWLDILKDFVLFSVALLVFATKHHYWALD